jgi:hypothetical protein
MYVCQHKTVDLYLLISLLRRGVARDVVQELLGVTMQSLRDMWRSARCYKTQRQMIQNPTSIHFCSCTGDV